MLIPKVAKMSIPLQEDGQADSLCASTFYRCCSCYGVVCILIIISDPQFGIMPRLSDQNRAIAIGHLQAGTPANQVTRIMNVTPKAKRDKFQRTGEAKELPKTGRPRVTTPAHQCSP